MELWFSELHSETARHTMKIKEHLCSVKSEYQKLDILDTYDYGRILVLDGVLMITEKDEFIYHEMVTHLPMAVNPKIEKVLVIGAGDGGTVSQLVKYKTIKEITMIEIDELVVRKCIEYFPHLTKGFKDERVTIKFEDGLKAVRKIKDYYDLIIVDSTDPFGPGEGLFAKEFYGNCYNALNENGILINQHESPFYDQYKDMVTKMHQRISSFFDICQVYQAHIPTYPSGHWLFGFASKKFKGDVVDSAWKDFKIECKYYNEELHKGSFALPNYVKELIK